MIKIELTEGQLRDLINLINVTDFKGQSAEAVVILKSTLTKGLKENGDNTN